MTVQQSPEHFVPTLTGSSSEDIKAPITPRNAAQLASPTYRLAALDQDFMLSPSMRGARFLLEFAKADEGLRAYGVSSTIVVFGGAHVSETGPEPQSRWYRTAREFGTLASRKGGALRSGEPHRHNVIMTGGGPGIMEAANRGATEAGAVSAGMSINLPNTEPPNGYTTPELCFQFHYFAMRKMHLAMRANGLVVFPGGFGTLDELFEILTLRQTGKCPPIPIVLVDRDFWESVIKFDVLVDKGMLKPSDLHLFSYAETAEEIWSQLLAGGLPPRGEPGWNTGRDIHQT